MSEFSDWSLYWYGAVTTELRREHPQSLGEAIELRAAHAHDTSGLQPAGASLAFEHAVLVLVDRDRDQVVLAALPQWFGETRQTRDEAEYTALFADAHAQAQANGVELKQLVGPGGEHRTAYLRRLAIPAADFLLPGGGNEFTPLGLEQIDAFVTAVAVAANAFFAQSVQTVAPPRKGKAGWIVLASVGGALVLALIACVVAGFANGYSHEVVVQEATEATYKDQPTGSYDVVEKDERICGGDEDYLSCINQHVAVYNSVCADAVLTSYGEMICESLSTFIEDIRSEYDRCGAGCTTAAGSDGTWGWPYLEQVAEMETVVDEPAQPEVTRTERCTFDLGPIEFGSCPR